MRLGIASICQKCRNKFRGGGSFCPDCLKNSAASQSSPLLCSYYKLKNDNPDRYADSWQIVQGDFALATALSDEKAALIVRRVNQGPAFDAVLYALKLAWEAMQDYQVTGRVNDILHGSAHTAATDAIKLAQEVKK